MTCQYENSWGINQYMLMKSGNNIHAHCARLLLQADVRRRSTSWVLWFPSDGTLTGMLIPSLTMLCV